MKNITVSGDEKFIQAARERARAEHTTLNAEFRRWLKHYARHQEQMQQRYDAVIDSLRGKLRVGRKLTREKMNHR